MQTSLIAWAGESLDQPGRPHTVDEPRQSALAEESAVASWPIVRRWAGAIRSCASASNQVSGSPRTDSSSRLSTLRTRRVCERRTARSSLVLRSDEGKAEEIGRASCRERGERGGGGERGK